MTNPIQRRIKRLERDVHNHEESLEEFLESKKILPNTDEFTDIRASHSMQIGVIKKNLKNFRKELQALQGAINV